MCTVSVKVDEEVLRGVFPELESASDIRQWAQKLIDARLCEIEKDAANMTVEELYTAIEQDVREVYADESI